MASLVISGRCSMSAACGILTIHVSWLGYLAAIGYLAHLAFSDPHCTFSWCCSTLAAPLLFTAVLVLPLDISCVYPLSLSPHCGVPTTFGASGVRLHLPCLASANCYYSAMISNFNVPSSPLVSLFSAPIFVSLHL
jgi:hypothetical protein